jgi:hypothetical protein
MEASMPGLNITRSAKIAVTAAAGLMLLSGVSLAQSGHYPVYQGGAYGIEQGQARATYRYGQLSPSDNYYSSHVCVNGFRWITRNINKDAHPSENAIPVPCH